MPQLQSSPAPELQPVQPSPDAKTLHEPAELPWAIGTPRSENLTEPLTELEHLPRENHAEQRPTVEDLTTENLAHLSPYSVTLPTEHPEESLSAIPALPNELWQILVLNLQLPILLQIRSISRFFRDVIDAFWRDRLFAHYPYARLWASLENFDVEKPEAIPPFYCEQKVSLLPAFYNLLGLRII